VNSERRKVKKHNLQRVVEKGGGGSPWARRKEGGRGTSPGVSRKKVNTETQGKQSRTLDGDYAKRTGEKRRPLGEGRTGEGLKHKEVSRDCLVNGGSTTLHFERRS